MTDTITLPRSVVEQALDLVHYLEALNSSTEQQKMDLICRLRAALKQDHCEHHLNMAQPQVEQEPVAWMNAAMDMTYTYGPYHSDDIPLYLHPQPPRQPLTDEQMKTIVGNVADIGGSIRIARAIERAHGIGGESKSRMCPSTYYECSRNCGSGACKDFSDAHRSET